MSGPSVNPLPPQAFTKETLQKAYSWLGNQPASIKELATTPELLVSLFLKAQRNGEESLNRPSIQNFKNELKSLAGMMTEFEGKKEQETQFALNSNASQTVSSQIPNSHLTHQANFATNLPTTLHSQTFAPPSNSTAISSTDLSRSLNLDVRSLAMIQEVKNDFNLSSDSEALRMLISLGYKKAKSI